MTQKEVATAALTLTVTNGGSGTASVTSTASTKVKANGQGIYQKQLDISISGCINGTCVQGAPVTDSIMPSGAKVKVESELVMRLNDKKQNITINGTDSGSGLPCSFLVDVEITNAGQTKVKAE